MHQEDFCQALGIASEHKYQKEGGPSLKQCFGQIRSVFSAPVLDLRHLLDVVIFNWLVGNNDAHGKNFSLLYTGNLPDIGRWIRALELPLTTPVEFENANNTRSPGRLNHVGIKVCWGGSSRVSQEWHEVALLAAITELWRCVTPSHGFELLP